MEFNSSRPTRAARRYTVRTLEFNDSPILSPLDTTGSFMDRTRALGLSRNQPGAF
jgi:hypothetical protein